MLILEPHFSVFYTEVYTLCSVSIMLKINMQPHLSIFASKNCILGDTVGMIIQKKGIEI